MAQKGAAQDRLNRSFNDIDVDATSEHSKRRERCEWLVLKLLTGDSLTGEEGRELWYTFIANGRIMQAKAMTGNSWTFNRLGQQEWAREQLEYVKHLNIDLYQKMEKEHYNRIKGEN